MPQEKIGEYGFDLVVNDKGTAVLKQFERDAAQAAKSTQALTDAARREADANSAAVTAVDLHGRETVQLDRGAREAAKAVDALTVATKRGSAANDNATRHVHRHRAANDDATKATLAYRLETARAERKIRDFEGTIGRAATMLGTSGGGRFSEAVSQASMGTADFVAALTTGGPVLAVLSAAVTAATVVWGLWADARRKEQEAAQKSLEGYERETAELNQLANAYRDTMNVRPWRSQKEVEIGREISDLENQIAWARTVQAEAARTAAGSPARTEEHKRAIQLRDAMAAQGDELDSQLAALRDKQAIIAATAAEERAQGIIRETTAKNEQAAAEALAQQKLKAQQAAALTQADDERALLELLDLYEAEDKQREEFAKRQEARVQRVHDLERGLAERSVDYQIELDRRRQQEMERARDEALAAAMAAGGAEIDSVGAVFGIDDDAIDDLVLKLAEIPGALGTAGAAAWIFAQSVQLAMQAARAAVIDFADASTYAEDIEVKSIRNRLMAQHAYLDAMTAEREARRLSAQYAQAEADAQLAAVLGQLAAEAAVQAVMETAKGLAAAAGLVTAVTAPQHFAAAAMFASIAAMSVAGGRTVSANRGMTRSEAERSENLDRQMADMRRQDRDRATEGGSTSGIQRGSAGPNVINVYISHSQTFATREEVGREVRAAIDAAGGLR